MRTPERGRGSSRGSRRRKKAKFSLPRVTPWGVARGALIAGVCLAGAFTSGRDAIAEVGKYANPRLALQIKPSAPIAAVAWADIQTSQEKPARLSADNKTVVLRALAEEPLNSRALRLLATAAPDNRTRLGLYTLSRRISRRDLPTSLFFVEHYARNNDVDRSIASLDTGLRTSNEARTVLFPALDAILAEPEARAPIARLFASRPDWLTPFFSYQSQSGKNLGLLSEVASRSFNPKQSTDRDLLMLAFRGAARVGLYPQMVRLYDRLNPGKSALVASPTLTEANFDPEFSPVTWDLSGGYATLEKTDGRNILVLEGPSDLRKRITQKLLILSPGQYRVALRHRFSAGEDEANLWVGMECADAPQARLFEQSLPVTSKPVDTQISFSVGTCKAARLYIDLRGSRGQQGSTVEISKVEIAAIARP